MTGNFHKRAFFDQFPFLLTGDKPIIADPEEVESCTVTRLDSDFLGKTPRYDGATGSLVDIHDSERIYLFDRDGNLLIEVKQGGSCSHNEAHMDNEEWTGETVGEALLRTDPTRVYYAVVVRTGYWIRDHHSVGGFMITIYKPPKNFTLSEWVEEEIRRAGRQIEAMIAAIDAEG